MGEAYHDAAGTRRRGTRHTTVAPHAAQHVPLQRVTILIQCLYRQAHTRMSRRTLMHLMKLSERYSDQ